MTKALSFNALTFAPAALLAGIISLSFAFMPMQVRAAGLTETQISAIVGLLNSFGADEDVVQATQNVLQGKSSGSSNSGSGFTSGKGNKKTSITGKTSKGAYTVGDIVKFSWKAKGAPENTQVEIHVRLLKQSEASGNITGLIWQSQKLPVGESKGEYELPTGVSHPNVPGLYEANIYLIDCVPEGCAYTLPDTPVVVGEPTRHSYAASHKIIFKLKPAKNESEEEDDDDSSTAENERSIKVMGLSGTTYTTGSSLTIPYTIEYNGKEYKNKVPATLTTNLTVTDSNLEELRTNYRAYYALFVGPDRKSYAGIPIGPTDYTPNPNLTGVKGVATVKVYLVPKNCIPADLSGPMSEDYAFCNPADVRSGSAQITVGSTETVSATPSITVTAPAGGEIKIGSTYQIKWSSTGLPSNAYLEFFLRNSAGTLFMIPQSGTLATPAQNTYSWYVTGPVCKNQNGIWSCAATLSPGSYKLVIKAFTSTDANAQPSGVVADGRSSEFDLVGDAVGLPKPTINSFKLSAEKIVSGQSTTLSWSVSNLQDGGCWIFTNLNSSGDPIYSNLGAQGSQVVTPTASQTYTLTCMSSYKDGYPQAKKSISVSVAASTTAFVPYEVSGNALVAGLYYVADAYTAFLNSIIAFLGGR